MHINGLKNIRKIYCTEQSEIYEASSEKGENPVYVLKKYLNNKAGEDVQNNEEEITQAINYYAPRSIVIPVFDKVYDDEGNEYLRMENKRSGMFLSEFIKDRNLSLDFVLHCGEEILNSLKVLHSFAGSECRIGYLHLDIHPGNIFMENADLDAKIPGNAKFLDLAASVKMINAVPQKRTRTYVSAYSAPELYYENDFFAPATDLYSVAAVLYSLLTGRPLPGCEGNTVHEHRSFLTGTKSDIAREAGIIVRNKCLEEGLAECVCQEAEDFFNCCLCLNPLYRPQNAQEMLGLIQWVRCLIKACQEDSYEEIFRAEYEHSKTVEEVHADTLDFNCAKFSKAVKSLGNQLFCDNIDVPFTKYLFLLYWEMAAKHQEELNGEVLFDLIGSGIAVGNHTADVVLANEILGQLEKQKCRMDISQYLFLLNRMAVQRADQYRFKEAYQLQERNISAQRILQQGICEAGELLGMKSIENLRNVGLSKALSSAAGYKAMAYPATKAQEIYSLYREALQGFTKASDRKITMSHMMHYAMMINDKDSFEKIASEYFGHPINERTENLERVLDNLLENLNDKYGFYAYVKAAYLFYSSQCIEDISIVERLHIAGKRLFPKDKVYDPIQSIYKYLALLEYKRCGVINERVEDYYYTSLRWEGYEGIEVDLPLNIYILKAYQTKAIFTELEGDDQIISDLTLQLKKQAQRDGWDCLVEMLDNGKALKDILTFEYA